MLPLLVSSVSFHWFDHMYLHERGREIERERDSEKEKLKEWEGRGEGQEGGIKGREE